MRQMTIWVIVVLSLAASTEARAQGDRQPPAPIDFPSADFLFGPPHATVGFRGNWLFARAGSDWFSFVTGQL